MPLNNFFLPIFESLKSRSILRFFQVGHSVLAVPAILYLFMWGIEISRLAQAAVYNS